MEASLSTISESLHKSVAEEKSEGPAGYYTGDPRLNQIYQRLDLMLVSHFIASLPAKMQRKIQGMYVLNASLLDVLYVVALTIWENTSEQRNDARLEVTAEFQRCQGESFDEIAERYLFYVDFIGKNTTMKFPVKESVKALHIVFEPRLEQLSKSLYLNYCNTGGGSNPNGVQPSAPCTNGGAASGATPGGAKPRDFSNVACWRCNKPVHSYFKCEETIDRVAGSGAGGSKWEPPQGKLDALKNKKR